MPLYVLLPVIMVVGVGAVIGTRMFYKHSEGKGKNSNPLNEFTRNAEEHTRNLASNGK